MDSMRSLNTSLPATASPRRRARQPRTQVIQAFKTAALQVTNLYKAAADEQGHSHSEGYYDALEDMLNFLDQENLGVGDGEGWRVRQWVTERLQESPLGAATSDEEDDIEEDKRARSSSPVMQRRSSPVSSPAVQNLRAEEQARSDSAPPEAAAPVHIDTTLPSIDFTFRASQAMPAHHDLDMEASDTQDSTNTTGNTGNSPPMQINVFPRHLRSSNRNGSNTHGRNNHRSSSGNINSLGSLGAGAGMKRRIPFDNFFDISGLGNGKDGFGGGGKRGRFT